MLFSLAEISKKRRFPVLGQNQPKFCRKACWNDQPFIFAVYLMNHIFQNQYSLIRDNSIVELTWLGTIHSWHPWKMLSKQNQAPVWNTCSRTRHQSGTLITEPDTSLEHCLDSNNTYTNYSSGHPISVDLLPLSPSPSTSVWIFYLTPSPHPLNVINVWPLV